MGRRTRDRGNEEEFEGIFWPLTGRFFCFFHVLSSFISAQQARIIFPYILARGGRMSCMIISVIFRSRVSNGLWPGFRMPHC